MMCWCVYVFFLCKQKTAYEMRISDGSSDVCSSDLSRGNGKGCRRLHRRNERADGPTQQPEGSSVMAILTGLMRLGRDAELKYTAGGDAIANLALAYNYGKKENGKQPSQWVDAALFGKRAESLAQYLTKGDRKSTRLNSSH